MTRPIGYYVHHHGDGHRQRAIAIGQAMDRPVTLLGTGLSGRSGDLPCIDLPDDRLDDSFAGVDGTDRPPALHYAPIDHDGIRRRVAALTQWIATARPALVIVDVSVEVAMLARLASVPTVYVRLNGKRIDRPHLDAFASATALLAPFHAALDEPDLPPWVRRKSFHAPTIVTPVSDAHVAPGDHILVVIGRGGAPSDGERWAQAARAMPDRPWQVIGPCTAPADPPPNLSLLGWVEDADRRIAEAGVVIGAAGDGLLASVLAHRRPFLCLPEPRPFDEQGSKAHRLAALSAAVVLENWPDPAAFPRHIAKAQAMAACWPDALCEVGGAARVAGWIGALAQQSDIRKEV
ncbi:glycosyltransferase [Sphingomonas ginsenosidimutans]|jgi:hypothetical protein|uniref:Glycosyltransferase n=1 Tax=Sphingomonas ginsenosidimutans TaxID=862134 RepID=A0A2A4HVM7_9SPHN|nr:glycosyltransferase [Sphingomonas ginsenosidimutans]PCG08420.1 glycosyltransferase [Sphingomonas ginsenosidimutans]